MNLELDPSSNLPTYIQIRNQLREQILHGDLPTGSQLPPERTLAHHLGVSRTTVVNAYDELKAEGLVKGYVGRGTIVEAYPHTGPHPIAWPAHITALGHRLAQSAYTADLPALRLGHQSDVISFALGMPDLTLMPPKELKCAWETIVERIGTAVVRMCPAQGLPAVREVIANRMRKRGIETAQENITVVNGSQHGLDLLLRLLLEPGDTVLVEIPTYFGALQCFQTWGTRVIGVPVDQDGMDVEQVEFLLARYHPKFIYTVPTYQNPTGATMSLERRERLLTLAQRYQTPIVEDDPFSDLYFNDPPPPPIRALDSHGHVLYLGTFSKILAPGLRVGWLAAPRPVVEQAALLNQITELQPNTPGQHLVTEFARQGWLEEQIDRARTIYAARCQAMDTALRQQRLADLHWTVPEGGVFLWLQLPKQVDAQMLLTETAQQSVVFLPGHLMYPDEGPRNVCRLNFSTPDRQAIERGIAVVTTAIRTLMSQPTTSLRNPITTGPIV